MSDSYALTIKKFKDQPFGLGRDFLLLLNKRGGKKALGSFLTRNGPDCLQNGIQLAPEEEEILLSIPTIDRRTAMGLVFIGGLSVWGGAKTLNDLVGNPLNPGGVELLTGLGKATAKTTIGLHTIDMAFQATKDKPDKEIAAYCNALSDHLAEYKRQLKKKKSEGMDLE